MISNSTRVLLTGFFCLCSVSWAHALSDDAYCSPITLKGSSKDRKVSYVDAGEKGLSAGDMRIGSRSLLDETGTIVGKMRWIATVMEPGEEGAAGITTATRYFELPKGTVFAISLQRIDNPFANAGAPSIGRANAAITGGTGAYEEATGYIAFTPGEEPTYEFDMQCG